MVGALRLALGTTALRASGAPRARTAFSLTTRAMATQGVEKKILKVSVAGSPVGRGADHTGGAAPTSLRPLADAAGRRRRAPARHLAEVSSARSPAARPHPSFAPTPTPTPTPPPPLSALPPS
jgi:hypothetical protein